MIKIRSITCSLTLVVLCTASAMADEDSVIRPFLNAHCVSCHNVDQKSGGLSLDELPGESFSESSPWESVVRKLRTRQMPPPGEERPSEADYNNISAALEQQLDAAARKNPKPGRTGTFRRLTREEYGNAIRDLLALNVDVSVLLPKDEVSHGFDNITVGDLSPTLLNRYISAAQMISQLAVGASVKPGGGQTFRIRPDITQEDHVPGLPLGTRGGVLIPFNFPADGTYSVAVRLMRDRNEHVEGLKRDTPLEVLLDRERIKLFTIPRAKSETGHQTADQHLHVTFDATAGPHNVGVTFPKFPTSLIETKREPYNARFNFHRSPRQEPAVYEVTITAEDAKANRATVTPSRRAILKKYPDGEEHAERIAKEILTPLMRQAYRRPVSNSDLQQPIRFFREANAEHGFESGIQEALASILVNPNFLFRIERDPPDHPSATPYNITNVELATRLSFFLWSSLPDERLLDLAESGQLRNAKVLDEEVERMLRDKRARSLVTSFASQWLYLRNLETITPDGRLFPDFDHNLREAFRTETERLFESVVKEDLSVLTLLSADYTFLNERLAKHYGIPNIYGSRFRRVNLPTDSKRGGLLRHASILTVTSYATRTSPVLRGHWILKNLLGAPPPPPPDDVPDLKDNTVDSTLSVRERLTAHRANPACASCHNLMDPIGFALENYDALGRWRDFDAGKPVDVSGGLPDGSEFSGVDGLEQGLLNRPELFVGTLSEKLLTFALGRGIETTDGPAIREVVRQAAKEEYRFSAVVKAIVGSTAFQMRMSE